MDLTQALQWIAEIFEEPAENITLDTNREDIKGWDSLGVLTLMAALDEGFGIQLSEDELLEMRTVKDILELFRRHGHLQ